MPGNSETAELLRTSRSWDGAALPPYPAGTPLLVAKRIIFPAGHRTGWHYHTVLNYGIVAQGNLTVVCRDGTERTFHEGEALVEVVGAVHRGENRGSTPVVLHMFYASTPGQTETVEAEGPAQPVGTGGEAVSL